LAHRKSYADNNSIVTATTSCVIAGLDPAIHHFKNALVKMIDTRVIWREDALRAFAGV
jgi:hypothetical protein